MGPAMEGLLAAAIELDRAATHWLQRSVTLGPAEVLLLPGAKGFGWHGFPVGLVAVVTAFGRKQLWYTMMSAAVGQITSRLLKGYTLRTRPRPPPGGVVRWLTCVVARPGQHLRTDGDGPAFPSGDSVFAGVFGASLALTQGHPLYLGLTLNAVVARSYFMYHWLGDTVVGAAIGVAASVAVHRLCHRITGREDGWREISERHVVAAAAVFYIVMRRFSNWDEVALAAATRATKQATTTAGV
mmetsp:Transcript_33446/g.87732  ORF Transcript_33446/g.87732 Transcript_33446/m.87732 type:complete len:242 (+) Transcript_33446:142-867(+)